MEIWHEDFFGGKRGNSAEPTDDDQEEEIYTTNWQINDHLGVFIIGDSTTQSNDLADQYLLLRPDLPGNQAGRQADGDVKVKRTKILPDENQLY